MPSEASTKIHRFETAGDVLKNATHHGVELEVSRDQDVIIARPKSRLTEELKQGIREHKDQLIRDLLMTRAMAFLNARYVKGANLTVLDEPGQRVEQFYPTDQPLASYRVAIREYVEAGLREFKRVREAGGGRA